MKDRIISDTPGKQDLRREARALVRVFAIVIDQRIRPRDQSENQRGGEGEQSQRSEVRRQRSVFSVIVDERVSSRDDAEN